MVVDLRGNGFGNAGAAALATALKQHTNEHLTELDIGYNEIKDDGACAIAQVRHAYLPLLAVLSLHEPPAALGWRDCDTQGICYDLLVTYSSHCCWTTLCKLCCLLSADSFRAMACRH